MKKLEKCLEQKRKKKLAQNTFLYSPTAHLQPQPELGEGSGAMEDILPFPVPKRSHPPSPNNYRPVVLSLLWRVQSSVWGAASESVT